MLQEGCQEGTHTPNQLQLAGSPGKPLKFVPIFTSRFFQGLWTQRNPLRPGAIGWQTEKFYGVNNDTLIDGLNSEVSNRLTLIRRPGTSVYNDQSFPAIFSFYSFRLFSTSSEAIKVIADTAVDTDPLSPTLGESIIYDATGPHTKTAIYTKRIAGSRARFQSIGNILYFGDGDVDKKWIQSLNIWVASTLYNVGTYFVDSNGNIQVFEKLLAPSKTANYAISSTRYAGGVAYIRVFAENTSGLTHATFMSLNGITQHSALNGLGGSIMAATPVTPYGQSFPLDVGNQWVSNNMLFVQVPFPGWPSDPLYLFPAGCHVTFQGAVDSEAGGGGIVTPVTVNGVTYPLIDAPTTTITFAVPYAHADYAVISASITNIAVTYGTVEVSVAVTTPGSWSDLSDTGFISVGGAGYILTNLGLVSIAANIITVQSRGGGFGTTLNPGVTAAFSGFANANLTFLNGTTGVVLTCTYTTLTCAYQHTDLAATLEPVGPAAIQASPTTLAPATIDDVTIAAGILTCTCVNTFKVGSAIIITFCATAVELNARQLVVSSTDGAHFTSPVPLADRALTVEGAPAKAQEVTGLISLLNGIMTITQPNSYQVGQSVVFAGLTNAAFLNGHPFTITSASANQYSGAYPDGTAKISSIAVNTLVATILAPNRFLVGQVITLKTNMPVDGSARPFPTEATILTADSVSFTIAALYDDTPAATKDGCTAYLKFTEMTDTGGTSTVSGAGGEATSGAVAPNFGNLTGSSILDGNILWTNHGSALQKMGIDGPVLAPQVALVVTATPPPPTITVWKAGVYYGESSTPAVTVVDNSGAPGPYLQQVTQPGITGLAQPSPWNIVLAGTTTDGTVVWTNKGTLGRIPSHEYQVGDRIAVIGYFNKIVTGYTPATNSPIYHGAPSGYGPNQGDQGGQPIYETLGPFSNYFTCTSQGTTSAAATSTITWDPASGHPVTDGTVTWTNSGVLSLWPGPSVDLNSSGAGSIVDSNGNIQNALVAGISGATQPTWSKVVGAITIDGQVRWANGGPSSGGSSNPSSSDTTTPGSWYYGFAFKNSFTNEVSNMSPISDPVVPGAGVAVSISGAGSTNPSVDTIEIYRTLQGGSTFFWLADFSTQLITGGTWNYLDVSPDPPSPDSTINILLTGAVNMENTPPAQGVTNWAFHLNRLWGSVGNLVVFSNPPGYSIGASYTQFPPLNYFTFSSKVTRLWPMGTAGILVFTVSDIYIITGTTTAAFSPAPFLKGVGLLNYDAFSVMGSIICMFTADGQVITLDPNSGVTEVGFPIGNLLNIGFSALTAYVSWHVSGSKDKAMYVADGSAGWYRLSPSSAPESGLMWSPYAAIVGGTSAVQSLEVAPGVVRLLIGS